MPMKNTFLILSICSLFFAGMQSCTKDSEEKLMQDFIYCADSNVSFANNVFPIINNDCRPCHSGASAEGGIELDDYAEIQSLAFSGDLMIVIKHESGLQPMPNGRPKLNECKITTLQKWIDEGMLNN